MVLWWVTLNACGAWSCQGAPVRTAPWVSPSKRVLRPVIRQAVGPNRTASYLPVTLAVMRHSGDQMRRANPLGGSLRHRTAQVRDQKTHSQVGFPRVSLDLSHDVTEVALLRAWRLADLIMEAVQAGVGRLRTERRRRAAVDWLLVHGPVGHEHGLDAGGEIERYGFDSWLLPSPGADRLRNGARG